MRDRCTRRGARERCRSGRGTMPGMVSRVLTLLPVMKLLLAAMLLLAPLAVHAEQVVPPPVEKPVIKNTYGFDWLRPKASKCVKISGALLAKLEKSYACKPADAGSASGKPITAVCTAKGKTRSEYVLLSSEADCKLERETQLANGE